MGRVDTYDFLGGIHHFFVDLAAVIHLQVCIAAADGILDDEVYSFEKLFDLFLSRTV